MLFKDEYKLPKGSVIELSRESNHVLKICSKFISFSVCIYLLLVSEFRWRIYFVEGLQELFKQFERCIHVAISMHVSHI